MIKLFHLDRKYFTMFMKIILKKKKTEIQYTLAQHTFLI